MKTFISSTLLAGVILLLATPALFAQEKTYPDGHGGEVTFPQGDVSFVDEVVRYDTGSKQPVEHARNPKDALGIPDYNKSSNRGYVSLGCGGELVLKFIDNALVDVPGPDLYVFEVGPAIEATALAISADGEDWIRVGRIEGGKAEIDIAPYVKSGSSFRYVRLVDLREHCNGDTPGADIDAVGAIGSAQRIALAGEVLFDTGKYVLKPVATDAINQALADVDFNAVQAVEVDGHTDSVGSDEANQILSENRAQSVTAYLVEEAGFAADQIKTTGYGESQPVADNDTVEGRTKNRRVEITLHSKQVADETNGEPKITILGLWLAGSKRVIELREEDDTIIGEYTHSAGRIRGKFTDETTFKGYWIKDKFSHTCDEEQDGSRYWGTLQFDFTSPERNAFDAYWAHCDDEDWAGRWEHAERIL